MSSGKRRAAPRSSVWPASVQPIVPLRSAATGFGSPALTSDCVPMMLRVRPAQLTITCVAGFGASARTRSTSSAPGTLVDVGMFIVWYSSKRRASTITTSAFASISACTSCADSDGVCRSASTHSPNDLLGTFTSMNSSPPAASQPARPPSSNRTSV
ncbi:hypothetical protein BCO18430_05424 [Burkholderia contaminans]|nr:hypothetical protein BCO18430_05424 [Burkholderia contaminans]